MKLLITLSLMGFSILMLFLAYLINSQLIVIPLFLLSLSGLVFTADLFVDKAAKIGKSLGLSNYLIGVFLIGFGTSTPELVTSIIASFKGNFEIAYFNVVGSNIANILLILAITILIMNSIKVIVQTNLLRTESLYLFASAIIPILLFLKIPTPSIVGIIPIMIFSVYLYINIKHQENNDGKTQTSYTDYIIFFLSLIGIVITSDFTINYLKQTAQILNVGVDIISILALAVGTSIPELVSSIILIRKNPDNIEIAVGNIIGSNIFNSLMILGVGMLSSYMAGYENIDIKSSIIDVSWWFLIVSTFALILIYLDKEIYKEDGMILLILYIVFLTMII